MSQCRAAAFSGRLAGLLGRSGSYVLVLACGCAEEVRVGRLGRLALRPGFYLYAGSALGSGGLGRRLERHLRGDGRRHWHIDYLRERLEVVRVLYVVSARRLEHEIARTLAALPGASVPLSGFGSSDCGCETHLFHFCGPPGGSKLEAALRDADVLDPGERVQSVS